MQNKYSENSNDQELCESLPLIKFRQLTDPEISLLKRKSRRTLLIILFIIFALPLFIAALLLLAELLSMLGVPDKHLESSIPAVAAFGVFIGLMLVVLFIKDHVKKYWIFRSVIRKRHVRHFEGSIKDSSYKANLFNGLSDKLSNKPPYTDPIYLEAFPDHDILYRFNRVVAKKWHEINITKAAVAVVEEDPAYYNIPGEWKGSKDEVDAPDINRRKLNQSEIDEIRFYYKRSLRKILYLPLVIGYLTAGILHLVLFRLIGFDEKHKLLVLTAGAIAAFILYGYKMYRNSINLKKDAEEGWVIHTVYYYEEDDNLGKKEVDIETEHLIHSEVIWRINNLPADWRHKNKKEPK